MRLLRLLAIFFLTLTLSLLGHSAVVDKQNLNAYRSFWYPTYHGQRLDYCSVDRNTCGEKIATRYCQLMGYEKAVQQVIAHNVGLTHNLDKKMRCQGWTCNGFKLIKCAKKIVHRPAANYYYRQRAFAFPRYDHYRIAWCYENQDGCGQRAATSFCRRMGYLKSSEFKQQLHVDATRALGDQRLCFGSQCAGFSRIVCSR